MLLLMSDSCDKMMEKRYSIKIDNKSSKSIRVTAGCSKFNMCIYPDTVLPSAKPFLLNVGSNDYNFLDHSFKWEDVISELPADTLSIYIFDAEIVDTNNWSQIKEGYLVLKRYDLSLNDLKQMNWTVTYP